MEFPNLQAIQTALSAHTLGSRAFYIYGENCYLFFVEPFKVDPNRIQSVQHTSLDFKDPLWVNTIVELSHKAESEHKAYQVCLNNVC